ncbi:MAG: hypothetical protein NC225_08690 [Clostridium sp.]|nr:hypothetical protein [Clostridium sp.]MCM1460094.1 hypothetical protein [Bacteroides sp.]
MFFNDIIKSENSSTYYDNWADYRTGLTTLISDSIEDYYRLSHLRNEKAIRSSKDFFPTDKKTSLAIWGAGSCSDIDIYTLARHFKLVLIDCELDTILAARSKAFEYQSDIICVNIPFWDIPHDTYELYEAMLNDKTPMEQIVLYLDEHIKKMTMPDYDTLPHFDFSVAVGLSSQLCSRFVALFSYYKHLYSDADCNALYHYFSRQNILAANRLLHALKVMTTRLLIIGYELTTYTPETFFLESEAKAYVDDFFHTTEPSPFPTNTAFVEREAIETTAIPASFENISFTNSLPISDIDGNAVLQNKIKLWLDENTARLLTQNSLIWDFNDKKHYLMHFISLMLDI